MRRARSRFGMGTHRRCICGGRGGRWPRRAQLLMALLLPDPGDPLCPEDFKGEARRILQGMRERPSAWGTCVQTDDGLRRVLLEFIGRFANWDNAADAGYLATGRALVRAAHPEETPLGGGPVCGRRIHSAGGAAAGLRGICQRPQSGGLPDPQSDAGGHSAARARAGPTSCGGLARKLRSRPSGIWQTCNPRTPTARLPSPISGRAPCAAKLPTAALKFRSCGRSGCARKRTASGPCGHRSNGRTALRPG